MGNSVGKVTFSFRTGIVTSVNAKKATVKVKFPDLKKADGEPLISYNMQVLRDRAYGDREYWMPDIDEQVFCLFLENGIESGFVLGGIYSEKDEPPVTDANKHHVVYKDESFWEYDRKEHKYTVKISGKDIQDDQQNNAQARDSAGGEGGGERGGTVDIFIEKTTDVYGKGNITVKCDADILIKAEGKIDVIAKKDVTVKTEANAIVEAEKDVTVKAGGSISMEAEKDISIKAGGNVTIKGSKINLN